ncbi:hypothetical protein RO3G_04036 [Rhizopus delemar RA 99-880]|uniref:Uncharacterized protein n=1 Tax=Rhizopus delemar (strain RA 99-880 / ATCC MYA-4621 / FGSC 9543 / NRRL 43880) TaxID=246409 RepID=I1BT01_RHIO9|nr:hypothetical protein RO3G_04036 [Rhizopus delemar RA 99-880]|eukprot:EIE79331.1 hypothetical protein RO3G_04036 [Rhizopus delemar RA 99-880]
MKPTSSIFFKRQTHILAPTEEGSRKIAETNFNPLGSDIAHILKNGITFENDAVKPLPCRALDPTVYLVRL